MITHIVGNRPQFIKLAPLYHELSKRGHEQCIIHSGQHYDENMSDVFFDELQIPKPLLNLGIGSGTHADMTAKAMVGIEKALNDIKPDIVILYGDTDTTLAAAIATSKLNIPIAHVEGGTRIHIKENPEERNRIVTDHMSDVIFCSDKSSLECAKLEGLGDRAHITGDIMYDTFEWVSGMDSEPESEEIILMTWHRQENTCSKERMDNILSFISKLEDKIICPMHPRTVKCLKNYDLYDKAVSIDNLEIIEPVGYFEMVKLMKKARLILTDSGGLSKESSFAGAKCLFMWDAIVWADLDKEKWIYRFDPDDRTSFDKAIEFAGNASKVASENRPRYYGDGNAACKMAELIEELL